jgi:hypothetical protein
LSTQAADEALFRAFVGARNADYYLAYFARAEARGYAPIAWHWPALLLGILWLVYRRLYVAALALFVASNVMGIVAGAAERQWPGSGQPLLLAFIVVALGLWLPLNANALYYRHARAVVDAARRLHPGNVEAQTALVASRGGVRPQLAAALIVLFIVSMLLSAPIAQA